MDQPESKVITLAKKTNRSASLGLVELVILMAFSVAPIFYFADRVDSDEFKKAAPGVAAVAAVAAYKLWDRRQRGRDLED